MQGFTETTEDRYEYMLGVLPPAYYGDNGFLVGEPVDHRECKVSGRFAPTFDAYLFIGGKYFVNDEAMTVREFKAYNPYSVAA